MTKLEKLVGSFLSNSSDFRFSDVEKVLSAFGFQEVRSKGSHHMFRHSDGRKLPPIPKKGTKVKKIYIRRIVQLLELAEWYEQQKKD